MFSFWPLLPNAAGFIKFVPSGFNTETNAAQQPEAPILTGLKPSPRNSPAVPLNVTRPFWPTRGIVMLVDAPPTAIVPVVSSDKVSVTEPVLPCGSMTMVYVPVVGSVGTFTSAPLVPKTLMLFSVVPSGFRMDTKLLQHVDVPSVTFVNPKPTFSPAVPENVT